MFEKTWIGATGQRWKMYVMFGLMGLTTALLVGIIFFLDHLNTDLAALMLLTFVLVGLLWFLWTFFSFNCPFCGCHVVWTVLRTLPHQESIYVAFFFLTHCPQCQGFLFEERSSRYGRGSKP